MAFSTTGPKGLSSEINVTPLIDVLLVLLIIFMVIVPLAPNGLNTLIPQPPKNQPQDPTPPRTIVVQLRSNGAGEPSYLINQTAFPKSALASQLRAIYTTRAEKVMFVKGDPDLEFSQVAEIVNLGRSIGVDTVGLITPGTSNL